MNWSVSGENRRFTTLFASERPMRNPSKGSKVVWGSSPDTPSRPRAGARQNVAHGPGMRLEPIAPRSQPRHRRHCRREGCCSYSALALPEKCTGPHPYLAISFSATGITRCFAVLELMINSSSICENGRRAVLSSGQLKVTHKGCNSQVLRSEAPQSIPVSSHGRIFTVIPARLSVNGRKAPDLRSASALQLALNLFDFRCINCSDGEFQQRGSRTTCQ